MVTTDTPLTIDDGRSQGSESPSLIPTFNEDFLLDLVEVLADTQETVWSGTRKGYLRQGVEVLEFQLAMSSLISSWCELKQ
ncbi:hypothetical protein LINPERPRIM_LOCUS20669 [Linum perenne]